MSKFYDDVWADINDALYEKEVAMDQEDAIENVPVAEHRVDSETIINPGIGSIDPDEFADLLED